MKEKAKGVALTLIKSCMCYDAELDPTEVLTGDPDSAGEGEGGVHTL